MVVNATDYVSLEFASEQTSNDGTIQLSRHRQYAPKETAVIGRYSPWRAKESFVLVRHQNDLLQVTLNDNYFVESIAQHWKQQGSVGFYSFGEVSLRNIEIQIPDQTEHRGEAVSL